MKRSSGILREYEVPPLDEAIAEELDAFVARRRAEIRVGKLRME